MTLREILMRFTPATLALSLALALTSSVAWTAAPLPLEPRAAALVGEGQAALAAGKVEAAIDAFEAALAVQPGSARITLELAEATRIQGLQGKALRYYRAALESEPRNFAAIAGEGLALVDKGAVEKARRNLARLQTVCGADCPETKRLAAALAAGPATAANAAPTERVVSADVLKPEPVVSN